MARYVYVYINHAYHYNWSASPCYLTTKSEVTAYTVQQLLLLG